MLPLDVGAWRGLWAATVIHFSLFYATGLWKANGATRKNVIFSHEWNARAVSTYHAIVVSSLCLYALFWDDLSQDKEYAVSLTGQEGIFFSSAYMLADFLHSGYVHIRHGVAFDLVMAAHHLSALACMILYFNRAQPLFSWVIVVLLLTELTTPLINLRWWMINTLVAPNVVLVHCINGSILLAWVIVRLNICTRVLLFAILCWCSGEPSHPFICRVMVSIALTLFVMNCYWFVKMICAASKNKYHPH